MSSLPQLKLNNDFAFYFTYFIKQFDISMTQICDPCTIFLVNGKFIIVIWKMKQENDLISL